jgi:hypothetical protein
MKIRQDVLEFLHVEGQRDVGKSAGAISELFDATATKM